MTRTYYNTHNTQLINCVVYESIETLRLRERVIRRALRCGTQRKNRITNPYKKDVGPTFPNTQFDERASVGELS